jgi:hypothetical protein
MLRVCRLIALVGLAGSCVILAQADDPPPSKKPSVDPGAADVRFADGSTVRMYFAQPTVDISTRYGKLSVPVEDIRRIEFGIRYPEGVQARIDAAIAKLGYIDAKEREAAAQELLTHRERSYPALKRLASGTDTDLARRARDVMTKLEEKVDAEKLKLRDLDTIHANEFVVTGRIEATTFKGRTTYFGEVAVQVAELKAIRFVGNGGGESELVIEAAKYAALSRDVWLDTDVDVHEGATLEIVAAGIVDLYPSGGNHKVGPDAMPRQGQAPDGTPSGMLLGRIGERGKQFQVGSKYSGAVSDSGRLYLRIECSPCNNASTGSYTVKINPNSDSSPTPAPALIKKKGKGLAPLKDIPKIERPK